MKNRRAAADSTIDRGTRSLSLAARFRQCERVEARQ